MNTSATGGVMLPADVPAVLDDVDLDAIFQTLVMSIIGFDGSMVRPRWQVNMPKEEDASVNWCSLGIVSTDADAGPYYAFDDVTLTGTYYRHESLNVLVSFYGPKSQGYASMLRDGLYVPQNTEALNPLKIRFVSSGQIRNAPEFFNQQWIRRQDMPLVFRRKVERAYPVLSLTAAKINIIDDSGKVNTTVIVPTGSTIVP